MISQKVAALEAMKQATMRKQMTVMRQKTMFGRKKSESSFESDFLSSKSQSPKA